MTDPSLPDLVYVAAAYAVILGGLALYAVSLLRRLGRARRAADRDPPPASSAERP